MTGSYRIVNVFIASPGDVPEERDRVRTAIGRLNTLLAHHQGIHLRVMGWEDVTPQLAARSQEVMNRYVDETDIFVGILKRRFGTPTGVAESGTQEEFHRIREKWKEAGGSRWPNVQIYFATLPGDLVPAAGSELEKVVTFKNSISATAIYGDYENVDALIVKVENAVAELLHDKPFLAAVTGTELVEELDENDVTVLAGIVGKSGATPQALSAELALDEKRVLMSVGRLKEHGLVEAHGENYVPVMSTEAIVVIVKRLNTDAHFKQLLRSQHFQRFVGDHLRGIIESRFHIALNDVELKIMRNMVMLSPATAAHVFYGNTDSGDKIYRQAQLLDAGDMARPYIKSAFQLRAALAYAGDYERGRMNYTIDGKDLAGQVLAIRLAAAFPEGRAFETLLVVPTMLFKAGGTVEAGALVTGPPSLHVVTGTTYLHLREYDQALTTFDDALKLELSNDERGAALNNRGLALEALHRIPEARDSYAAALRINPDAAEPKANLARLDNASGGEVVS